MKQYILGTPNQAYHLVDLLDAPFHRVGLMQQVGLEMIAADGVEAPLAIDAHLQGLMEPSGS